MLQLRYFLLFWLFSTNHKELYLIFSLIAGTSLFFLIISAPVKKANIILKNNYHAMVISLVMIFFMVMLVLIGGFGNWFVPLMIGAPDMAFSRLNNISFWLLTPSLTLLTLSFYSGTGAGRGLYPKLCDIPTKGYLGHSNEQVLPLPDKGIQSENQTVKHTKLMLVTNLNFYIRRQYSYKKPSKEKKILNNNYNRSVDYNFVMGNQRDVLHLYKFENNFKENKNKIKLIACYKISKIKNSISDYNYGILTDINGFISSNCKKFISRLKESSAGIGDDNLSMNVSKLYYITVNERPYRYNVFQEYKSRSTKSETGKMFRDIYDNFNMSHLLSLHSAIPDDYTVPKFSFIKPNYEITEETIFPFPSIRSKWKEPAIDSIKPIIVIKMTKRKGIYNTIFFAFHRVAIYFSRVMHLNLLAFIRNCEKLINKVFIFFKDEIIFNLKEIIRYFRRVDPYPKKVFQDSFGYWEYRYKYPEVYITRKQKKEKEQIIRSEEEKSKKQKKNNKKLMYQRKRKVIRLLFQNIKFRDHYLPKYLRNYHYFLKRYYYFFKQLEFNCRLLQSCLQRAKPTVRYFIKKANCTSLISFMNLTYFVKVEKITYQKAFLMSLFRLQNEMQISNSHHLYFFTPRTFMIEHIDQGQKIDEDLMISFMTSLCQLVTDLQRYLPDSKQEIQKIIRNAKNF